jgi:hypothetical protein
MVFKLYECDCLVDRTKKLRINHWCRLEAIEAFEPDSQEFFGSTADFRHSLAGFSYIHHRAREKVITS